MRALRGRSGEWMGRVAALLFVLHAVLLGFAFPASADLLPRDQFGNVLCVSAGEASAHASHGEEKPGHSSLPSCCSLGCSMYGGPVPAPSILSFLVRQPLVLDEPFVLFEGVGSGAVETPRNTRGPPLLG